MNTQSPESDHEELKALLADSFQSEEADDVPPLPDDLRERIRDQYGQTVPARRARSETLLTRLSFLTRLSRLFAQPAFSGAAAAIILITLAAIFLIPDGQVTRGNEKPVPPGGTRIVIYGFEPGPAEAIAANLDPDAVVIVEDLSGQGAEGGRTIVIDGADREIEGYTGPGPAIQSVPLPENPAEVAFEVAKMAKALKEE